VQPFSSGPCGLQEDAASQHLWVDTVVPVEITFMDTEDEYKKYGTLRSLRYIYSNPFLFSDFFLGLA
jgi:hypothetical protein